MFNHHEALKHLQSSYGVECTLSHEFGESLDKQCLGSVGMGLVGDAINCLLVGWNDPVRELLEKAETFLTASIEGKEKGNHYFEFGTDALRHESRALCRLFLQGAPDRADWREAAQLNIAYYQRGRKIDKGGLSLALVDLVLGERPAELLSLYHQAGLKPPPSAAKARTESALAYVIASDEFEAPYTETFNKVFSQQVPAWLARGHHVRVAKWMCVAYLQPAASPQETLWRCYDFLPGVSRPGTS